MVLAIIQARMGSTRLPGKVLFDLCGEPVIVRIINRLRRSTLIENIVVATTTRSEDDELCRVVADCGQPYFRGSETNLIKRFYDCAAQFFVAPDNPEDIVVRVCGDQPFVDTELIDFGLAAMTPEDDVVAGGFPSLPYGVSVEIFRMPILDRCHSVMDHVKDSHREHLFPLVKAIAPSVRKVSSTGIFTVPLALDTRANYDHIKRLCEEGYDWRNGRGVYTCLS